MTGYYRLEKKTGKNMTLSGAGFGPDSLRTGKAPAKGKTSYLRCVDCVLAVSLL